MAVTHGRYLQLEKLVSIYIELITYIIGIASWGEDPMYFLEEKTKEKELVEEMKNKYGTKRGSCGIIIKHISDVATRMDTKIMACKLLRKLSEEEVPAQVVAVEA